MVLRLKTVDLQVDETALLLEECLGLFVQSASARRPPQRHSRSYGIELVQTLFGFKRRLPALVHAGSPTEIARSLRASSEGSQRSFFCLRRRLICGRVMTPVSLTWLRSSASNLPETIGLLSPRSQGMGSPL